MSTNPRPTPVPIDPTAARPSFGAPWPMALDANPAPAFLAGRIPSSYPQHNNPFLWADLGDPSFHGLPSPSDEDEKDASFRSKPSIFSKLSSSIWNNIFILPIFDRFQLSLVQSPKSCSSTREELKEQKLFFTVKLKIVFLINLIARTLMTTT